MAAGICQQDMQADGVRCFDIDIGVFLQLRTVLEEEEHVVIWMSVAWEYGDVAFALSDARFPRPRVLDGKILVAKGSQLPNCMSINDGL
jgi:hypothetical protein